MKQNLTAKTWLLIFLVILLLMIVSFITFLMLRPAMARATKDFYYPVFKIVNQTKNITVDASLLLQSKKVLAEAITLLQKKNNALAVENAELKSLRKDNEILRRLCNISTHPGYQIIHAEILLRDPLTWLETFTIDHGSSDGISAGDLVVTVLNNGEEMVTVVVGRITDVSRNTAEVSTILNPDCHLGVYLADSTAYGVHGVLNGPIQQKYAQIINLPKDVPYTVHQIVTTSKASLRFPPDIPIGTLAANEDGTPAVRIDETGLAAEAKIIPAADLTQLRFVAVYTKKDDKK